MAKYFNSRLLFGDDFSLSGDLESELIFVGDCFACLCNKFCLLCEKVIRVDNYFSSLFTFNCSL